MTRLPSASIVACLLALGCAPEPLEGYWEVEVLDDTGDTCLRPTGAAFEAMSLMKLELGTLPGRFELRHRRGEASVRRGGYYGAVQADGRDFESTSSSYFWMFDYNIRGCTLSLSRDMSGRINSSSELEWVDTTSIIGRTTQDGRPVPCTFPHDNPDLSPNEVHRALPNDLRDLPPEQARPLWERRYPHPEDPCVEQRTLRATFFAEELPEPPPRPRDAPPQDTRAGLALFANIPPVPIGDDDFIYSWQWKITPQDGTPFYQDLRSPDPYAYVEFPAGAVTVTLVRRRPGASTEDPWEPFGPTKTIVVGQRIYTAVHALGYPDPPNAGDLAMRLDHLPDLPLVDLPWASPSGPFWDYDEPVLVRFLHGHADAAYRTVDLWTLDEQCRPVGGAPAHAGLRPGDYLSDLVWPAGERIVLGVDAGSDGTIDHCFRLPEREFTGAGGPIVTLRSGWGEFSNTFAPVVLRFPLHAVRQVEPEP